MFFMKQRGHSVLRLRWVLATALSSWLLSGKITGFEHLLGVGLHQVGRTDYWRLLRYVAKGRGQKEQKLIL